MADVSVIVPIYNMEPYLRRCLDSLAAQSHPSIEVILVDDGSTDSSGEICQEYCRRFDWFSYCRKANGGLSDARNWGLERATGQWLAFVDSDDYVEPDYISKLYAAATEGNVKLACCGYYQEDDGQRQPVCCADTGRKNAEAYWQKILTGEEIGNYVWNKLFLAELFSGIRFPVGKKYEDIFTVYKLVAQCQAIEVIADPLYHYMCRASSLARSYKRDNARDLMAASAEMCDYAASRHPQLKDAVDRYLYLQHIYNLNALSKAGIFPGVQEWDVSAGYVRTHWQQQKALDKKYRLSAWLIRAVPGCYSRMLHWKQQRRRGGGK